MGLDMYLTRSKFLGFLSDKKGKIKISGVELPPNAKIEEIIIEGIYWRKANAIHRWFVENVQNGDDSCGYWDVSRESLNELLNLITNVIKTKDTSLLPTQEGFFFGETKYDEYYWECLERTKKELTKLLKETPDDWDFKYNSAW